MTKSRRTSFLVVALLVLLFPLISSAEYRVGDPINITQVFPAYIMQPTEPFIWNGNTWRFVDQGVTDPAIDSFSYPGRIEVKSTAFSATDRDEVWGCKLITCEEPNCELEWKQDYADVVGPWWIVPAMTMTPLQKTSLTLSVLPDNNVSPMQSVTVELWANDSGNGLIGYDDAMVVANDEPSSMTLRFYSTHLERDIDNVDRLNQSVPNPECLDSLVHGYIGIRADALFCGLVPWGGLEKVWVPLFDVNDPTMDDYQDTAVQTIIEEILRKGDALLFTGSGGNFATETFTNDDGIDETWGTNTAVVNPDGPWGLSTIEASIDVWGPSGTGELEKIFYMYKPFSYPNI